MAHRAIIALLGLQIAAAHVQAVAYGITSHGARLDHIVKGADVSCAFLLHASCVAGESPSSPAGN